MEWREEASCRGNNGEPFYPAYSGEREGRQAKRSREQLAKRICSSCPVQGKCLDWALRNREMNGVWGGKSEVERRVMLRASS